jgi:alanine-glyoxylate transaminase/serine-glyoxylate transaminase/serine-pyruvate transaminase
MVGSGSCAIDSCIGSVFKSGEKIIVGVNGFFGERLNAIAHHYELDTIIVAGEWGKTLSPQDFSKAIEENPDAVGVCVVHLETSTTIINPIKEIGQIVRNHGLCFIVDAVSSLGGLPFQMDEWNIDLCASASQKCLGAPPGIAPVAIGSRGWEFIDRNLSIGHGWYSDLRVWRKYANEWSDWHPFPITMATNNVLALKISLESLIKEGIENRLNRYKKLATRLRNGLRDINMPPFTPDEMMAPVITAAYGPIGVDTSKIVDFLAREHMIKIAGGLGELKNKIFRIGHMAPTVTDDDIDLVLDSLGKFKQNY